MSSSQLPSVQWYPGHIAKWDRELDAKLNAVDVVVEVLDARAPLASRHPKLFERLGKNKPVIALLNKADLAASETTKAWKKALKNGENAYFDVQIYEAHHANQCRKTLLAAIERACAEKIARLKAKGLKQPTLRVMLVGMPNVGKSSILNSLIQQKSVKTGHRAGVTRVPQWVRVLPGIELLDSPGVIPAERIDGDTGLILGAISAIGDNAFEEISLAEVFLAFLWRRYPSVLGPHYGFFAVSGEVLTPTLAVLAKLRQCLQNGGLPDLKRAAQLLLKDFRQGRLGRISLELPPSKDPQETLRDDPEERTKSIYEQLTGIKVD